MDPDACLAAMVGAMESADPWTAMDRAADLIEWLDRGGNPPRGRTVARARAYAASVHLQAREQLVTLASIGG